MYDLSIFEEHLKHQDLLQPEISAWSVGEQIHHCSLAAIKIQEELRLSQAGLAKPKFSLFRSIVFRSMYIPRGNAKSPTVVLPKALPLSELQASFTQASEAMHAIPSLDQGHWMKHPVFGILNPKLAYRFLEVHNRHHLKIIKDIIKAS